MRELVLLRLVESEGQVFLCSPERRAVWFFRWHCWRIYCKKVVWNETERCLKWEACILWNGWQCVAWRSFHTDIELVQRWWPAIYRTFLFTSNEHFAIVFLPQLFGLLLEGYLVLISFELFRNAVFIDTFVLLCSRMREVIAFCTMLDDSYIVWNYF